MLKGTIAFIIIVILIFIISISYIIYYILYFIKTYPQPTIKNKKKYVVVRDLPYSGLDMPIKTFDTYHEAEEYIRIQKNNTYLIIIEINV